MNLRVRRIWRFLCPKRVEVARWPNEAATTGACRLVRRDPAPDQEVHMGLLDRLLGRGKKAAGDLVNDPGLRREGTHQEREGVAEDRAEDYEDRARAERERAAEHRVERTD
jgi:uncharacterized protein YjbJ (UPF0337 family)